MKHVKSHTNLPFKSRIIRTILSPTIVRQQLILMGSVLLKSCALFCKTKFRFMLN